MVSPFSVAWKRENKRKIILSIAVRASFEEVKGVGSEPAGLDGVLPAIQGVRMTR